MVNGRWTKFCLPCSLISRIPVVFLIRIHPGNEINIWEICTVSATKIEFTKALWRRAKNYGRFFTAQEGKWGSKTLVNGFAAPSNLLAFKHKIMGEKSSCILKLLQNWRGLRNYPLVSKMLMRIPTHLWI